MVENWAFIYCSPGFNPKDHTTVVDNGRCKITMVGVDVFDRDAALDIAKQLVAEGCQMIELCGGFGPLYIAKIKEATDYAIPVGSTMYGPEDRQAMIDITRGQLPEND